MKMKKKSSRTEPRQLVCGVGVNDADYKVTREVNGKRVTCPFYRRWVDMMGRCYNPKYLARFPTYLGCSIDPLWISFMTFRAWMVEQPWHGRHLDKDILIPGNKMYSPETCLFVPQAINKLLNDHAAARGELPQGITWHKQLQKFHARIRINGKHKHLGLFPTVAEAEAAYLTAKADHIFSVAYLLDENEDPRLKPALLQIASTYENA